MDILGIIERLIKGRQVSNPLAQNPNIESPLPAYKEATEGFNHYKWLNEQNMNAPIGEPYKPRKLEYPEWLANAPRREVLGEQSTRSVPTPTSTPVPNPNTLWESFTNLIREEAGLRGYNPDVLIKQKALESAFGTSNFARERNNFGGIGAYTQNPENAFRYESPQDYLQAYFDLIEDRFPQAYENRADPKKYLEGLLNGTHGAYATDPNYVSKVLSTPLMPR